MAKAETLKLTPEELQTYLDSDNTLYEPPGGLKHQKGINLLMACGIVVKTFDEQKRRASQEAWDAVCDLREALEEFDGKKAVSAGLRTCQVAAKENPKLASISLDSVKVLLLALVDSGAVKPPREADVDVLKDQIYNMRMVVYTIASNLGKKIEKDENPKTSEDKDVAPTN